MHEDARDLGLAISLLCELKGWTLARLSRESGVDKGLISDYLKGTKRPTYRTLTRLAAAFEVEPDFLVQLTPVCRRIRLAFESATRQGGAEVPATGQAAQGMAEAIGAAALAAMEPFLLNLAQPDHGSPRAEDHAWAESLWARMEPLPAENQDLLADVLLGDDRSWALAVRLCDAAAAAAAHRADEAMRLARLAVRLAEEASVEKGFRQALIGYCEPFLANALRVAGDLPGARETFAHADRLWSQGNDSVPAGLLDATRRLDLKASLLRQDGKHEEALDLLDQALAGSPPESEARLLLKKATTHARTGHYELALEALRLARPRIDPQREPRLVYGYHFSRAHCLCHLDRYREAEPLVPVIEELAAGLGTELDGIRTLWIRGRTAAGLGRREEAVAALAQVRQYFLTETIAYDFALASLELAALYLEEGRTRQVQELALEMKWIFDSQQVHQEALAALTLFCQAAKAEKAGAEWTHRLVKYLYRAQHNPELRFES
jgi:transcriptional regulator with XRE-family HTH domain